MLDKHQADLEIGAERGVVERRVSVGCLCIDGWLGPEQHSGGSGMAKSSRPFSDPICPPVTGRGRRLGSRV